MSFLSGGFDSQLATILAAVPSNRQTLLFTATTSPIIHQTIAACPNYPHTWQCASVAETATVSQLDQRFVLTPFEAKNGFLVQIVLDVRAKRPADSIMVFTKTCKTAELLDRAFRKLGLLPSSLHSMKPQKERMAALALFKSNQTKLLIATDVASRGLDIPEVELVVNHNVPSTPRVSFLMFFAFVPDVVLLLKGIVSRDFEWLQMILMNRLCVPDVPLEVYSFLKLYLHIVF